MLCKEIVSDIQNNFASYCGLVDAEMRASDKDLPVSKKHGMRLQKCFYPILTLFDKWNVPLCSFSRGKP